MKKKKLRFSHLRGHKFKHGLLYAIDPLCSCSTSIKNISLRNIFLNEISNIGRSVIDQDEPEVIQTFIYGNKLILDASIKS